MVNSEKNQYNALRRHDTTFPEICRYYRCMPIGPPTTQGSGAIRTDTVHWTAETLTTLLQGIVPPPLQAMAALREVLYGMTRNGQRSLQIAGLLGAPAGQADPRIVWDAIRAWVLDDDVSIERLWSALKAREIPQLSLGSANPRAAEPVTDVYVPPEGPVTDIRSVFWHEVRDHMGQDVAPSLSAMRMLRQFLFKHTGDHAASAEVAALLGQPTGTPNPEGAWKALRSWVSEEMMSLRDVAALFAVQDPIVSDAPIFGPQAAAPVVARPAKSGVATPVTAHAVAPPTPVQPLPATPEAVQPIVFEAAATSNLELMRQLRDAWTKQSVIPSPEVQRFLISMILGHHVLMRDEVAQTELRQIQFMLNANDPKKTAEAWDKLRVWAKRRAFTDREFRMRLSHFSSPAPKALSADDVSALASPAHRSVYNILLQMCAQNGIIGGMKSVTSVVRYPPQLPRQWLDDGVPTVFTVARARLNGWKVVDLMDSRFIVPPTDILQYLLSPADYTHLVDFGIAPAASVPTTTGATASLLDDLSGKLVRLLPRTEILLDKSNRTIHLPADFDASPVTNDEVFRAISKGATLIYLRGELYLLPLSDIGRGASQISGEELLKLNTFGIIGLRGGPASPWWHLQDNTSFNKADPFAMLREPAAGELNFIEFVSGQLGRWSGDVQSVVDLNHYPWLRSYPELRHWLRRHLSHVELQDMKRIESYLDCAEHAASTEAVAGAVRLIQGVMGEIVIRPQIVESYHDILQHHPKAVLVLAPQIHSGDIREASDAVIFEIVQNRDVATIHLLSAWEVTTSQGGISAEKRKLDRALMERYAERGVHFRGNDGRGISLPIEHNTEATDTQAKRVELPNHFMTVVQSTLQQIMTRFGQHEWNTNEHGVAIERGAERVGKVTPHMEMALSGGYSYEEFDRVLAEADLALSTIFRNMTRPPLGQRKMGVELELVIPLSVTSISRWEALFEDICKANEWSVAARNAMAESIILGKQRKKAAAPILEKARSGRFATPQELYAELVAADSIAAAVLKNMTHPEGGIRASQMQLAKDNGVKTPSIQSREKQIAELCLKCGWVIVPMSGQSLASHTAKTSGVAAKKFISDAMSSDITFADFCAGFRAFSEPLGGVLDNMVAPKDGVRLRPATLKDIVGFDNASIGAWEKLLDDLFRDRGWSAAIKPLQTIADLRKSSKLSHARQGLIEGLQILSELHGGRPLTEADLDPALGVATAEKYSEVFGSFENALVAAGIMVRPAPKPGARGLATLEMMTILGTPVTLPILGAYKLALAARANAAQLNKAATQTLRGGAVFFLGSLGADVVEGLRTGDWKRFKEASPLGLARDFAGLTVGGEVGRLTSVAAVSRIPTRIMPVPVKGTIVRGGSMAAGLTAVQWLATGNVDFKQLPHDLAVCLGASAIVKVATAVLGRSPLMQGAATMMKLTRGGKATLLGAVAHSIAEFTVMREITRFELWQANRPTIDKVRAHILTLLQADIEIQKTLQSEGNVDGQVVDEIGKQYGDLARMLAATPDVDGQIVEMDHDAALQGAEEARVIAAATGNPDAEWNSTQRVRRLERKRDARLADIRAAESKDSLVSLMEAAEFQETGDDAVGLSMAANATALDALRAAGFPEILGHSYHTLSRQLTDYLRHREGRLVRATENL